MKNNREKIVYMCTSCGNESLAWSGKCEFCGEWNTIKEMRVSAANSKNATIDHSEIKKISEIVSSDSQRLKTGIDELDRVLGGGLVKGSIILLGGEPGIGKSTLTLQLCSKLERSFYISAEESLEQIKGRANRLGVKSDMLLVSSGDLLALEKKILEIKPELLIVDSIQTVYLSDIPTSAGSLTQVRECGIFLQRLAKKKNITILIVGHVTKDGSIAGPKIIEHLVDVVLYLEGERYQGGRILRGIKNRFGATNEIGLFSLEESGLKEISNPSELFLSERSNKPGSVVCSIMEGRRPLLVEIQALTIVTNFGYPKRTASGFDLNRLNILAAVIQKNTGINLSNCDIYLNVVGGIKINEPAVDLAVCAAIISSYKNKPLDRNLCIFGEVGLMGEIRKVNLSKDREKECKKLGYKTLDNVKDLKDLVQKI